MLLLAQTDTAPQAITFTYYPYPPKMRVEGGTPTGAHPDAIRAITDRAGLALDWLPAGITTETRMLDDGRRAFCTTGRIYSDERAKRWSFLPFIFDAMPGDVAVTRKELEPELRGHGSMAAVVRDPSLRGALHPGSTYGSEIDSFVKTPRDWLFDAGESSLHHVQMVISGRADYTIIPGDQWHTALQSLKGMDTLVMIDDLGTLPPTQLSLACSHGVDADTFSRLRQAMQDLGYKPRKIAQ